MANIQKNFANVVALGSQNPQILNEDFLKNNKIIPADQSPFDKCTRFVSTPPFATIAFGSIEILVEEQRFQIREAGLSDWNETQIFDIAKKYYSILKYTPITIVGLNLNSQVNFENSTEAEKFQRLLLPGKSKIIDIISEDNIDISLKFRYPYAGNGRVLLSVDELNPDTLQRQLNFNYEFNCIKNGQTDWSIIDTKLSNVNGLSKYFSEIIDKLLKEV